MVDARGTGSPLGRPSVLETIYVVSVVFVAGLGFGIGSAWLILLAVGLTLPTGLAAMLAYSVIYGLLALVPGANPSTATGSGSANADGTVVSSSSSDGLATWFSVLTPAVGVALMGAAACVNVLLYRSFVRARKARAELTISPSGSA